jgi:PAS domain S-box-containing protein
MNKNILEKLKNPAIYFMLAVITSGLVTSLVGFHAYKVMEDVLKNSEQAQVISKGVEKIFLYDEVLTNSALMAASTGNPRWEIRYRSIEPKLDSIINKMLEINTLDSIGQTLKQTDTANLLLVEMENRVFELVNRAKPNEAYQIVAGSEYNKQKIIYSEGLSKFVLSLEKAIENEQNRLKDEVRRSKWVFSLMVLLLSFFWLIFERYLSRNRKQVLKLNRELQLEIEAHRDSENALQKSNEQIISINQQLSLLMESSPAMIYTCQAFGNFDATYISENIKKLLGYQTNEFLTIPGFWATNIHPEDQQRVFSELTILFEKGTYEHEYRFKHYNGSWRWMSDSLKLIKDDSGNPVQIIGYWLDITKKKQHEQKINELNERFQLIAKATNDTIYDWDLITNTAWWGDGITSMFGYPPEMVEGTLDWFLEKVHPDNRETVGNGLDNAIGAGLKNWGSEYKFRHNDGRYLDVLDRAFLLCNESGNPIRFVGTMLDITERKRAEKEIYNSKEQYRLLVETAPDIIFTIAHDGRFTSLNQSFESTLLWKTDEWIGKSFTDIIHPDDLPALLKIFQNTLNGNAASSFEYRARTQKGSYIYLEAVVKAIWENGIIKGVFGISRDITERREAEEKITKAQEQLRESINASGIGLWDLNLQTNEAYLSAEWKKQIGYEDHELQGGIEVFTSRLHPDDAKQMEESMNDFFSGKREIFESEYKFRHRDGSYLWISGRAAIKRDNTGKPLRLYGTHLDITERKKAEEKINMLAHAVKSSGDCISITDIDNTILFVNDAFLATYGFTPEELIDKPIEIVRTGNNENDKHILPSTLNGHWQGEVLNKRKNGTEFPIFLSTSQVLDEKGNIISLVGIARDITKQKEYEQELQLAKEAAEGANRAKSEFLSNISHELRTPLNGIIGMTDIVAGTALTKNQERFVNNIKNSGESLLAIINDLLDFSKIEGGKLELAEVEFSLRDELASILKPQGLRAFSKGLELLYNIDGAIPETVIGDSQRLEQIITNLIGNAIKFTEHGSVMLSAKEESREGEKISLHFTVADTGIGIPKEKQKLIFKSFTQADNSVQRQFGGTGLGLAISASLVDLFGGRIWVESEPGNLSAGKAGGAAFHFVVPLKLSENTAPILYKADALDGVPVLVVDDNPLTAKLLKEIFAGWGMKPKIVLNGEDALVELRTKFANNNPYKILFLDIRLPGMDGFAVAETLKNDSGLKNLPIIIISMSHSPSDFDRANQLGVEAFLTKPFSHSELFNTVQEVLFKKGGTVDKLFNAAEVPAKHSQAVDEFGVRPLKILAVDDNDLNHEILFEYLTGRNHSITIAKNGEEAVNYNTGNHYDLILMDLHMPVMDGFAATRAIRAKEEETNKHVIIIALTASAMKNEIEKCHAAGMDGHLSKPIRPKELFRVIHSFFSADPVPVKAKNPEMDLNINKQYALEQLNGDSKMLIRLANIFMDKSPVIFNEFENTLATADRATIRSAAHKFKGSLPVFTPPYFMEYFLKYEQEIREKDLTLAKEKLKFVKKSYLALLRQTKEMVEEVMSREQGAGSKE